MNRYLLHTPRPPMDWHRPIVGMQYFTSSQIWTITKIEDHLVWAVSEDGQYYSATSVYVWWAKFSDLLLNENP